MSSECEVRLMLPSDAVRVKEIIDLSFSAFMGFFALRSVRQDGQVLVCEEQGSVVGFAKLIDFRVGGKKFGCILWIAVHPKFRRKGVANALTTEGLRRLKHGGAKAVFASTQGRNVAALRVLKQNGFRRIGFVELCKLFGSRVLEFYGDIWLAPGEVVLIHD